jgi:hypothetical protein
MLIRSLHLLDGSLRVEVVRFLYKKWKNNPHSVNEAHLLETLLQEENVPAVEWVSALADMVGWLESNSVTAAVTDIVGYIECCKEMGGRDVVNEPLRVSVKNALAQFGFSRATPALPEHAILLIISIG